MNKAIRDYMASLGRKGGKAKGEKKRRSPEFYALLAQKGVEARAARRASKARALQRKRAQKAVVDSKSVDN